MTVAAEIVEPRHNCPVVVKAKIMYIFDNEQVICCSADLTYRRDEGVREDIFVDPGIVDFFRPTVSDGMKEKKTVIFQTSVHDFHVSPVVLQPQFDGQSFAQLHPQFLLSLADSNANNSHPISLGSITGKAAPTVAAVQDLVSSPRP